MAGVREDHLTGADRPATTGGTVVVPDTAAAGVVVAADMAGMTGEAVVVAGSTTDVGTVFMRTGGVDTAAADVTTAAGDTAAVALVVRGQPAVDTVRADGMDDHPCHRRTSVRCHWRIQTDPN